MIIHKLRWYRGNLVLTLWIFFKFKDWIVINMRYFEKISFEQFKKDISCDKDLYNNYILPKRATKNSVGYDFFAINDISIKPGEIVKIPTGYKAKFNDNEALLIIIRSSLGFKYNLRLTNQVGLIESDYYNNESNEGHMWVSLQNEGQEEVTIKKNTAYSQGIFINFLKIDNDETTNIRKGGLGSTDRRNEK